MAKTILETQKDSYFSILEKLNERQIVVFMALTDKPSTLFELEARLGWPINCISGRVTELKAKNLIAPLVVGGNKVKRMNPKSGKLGVVFSRVTKSQQPDLFRLALDGRPL